MSNANAPAFPLSNADFAHAMGMAASVRIGDSAERERTYIEARAQAVKGLTKREYFAGLAMQGYITRGFIGATEQLLGQRACEITLEEMAVRRADALLAELAKVKP